MLKYNKKCKLFEPSIVFLGFKIDEYGIHPIQEKLSCINDTPPPKTATQLRSYLGMLNYYSKFIPMFSVPLKPLYFLSKGSNNFVWLKEHQDCFELSKRLLLSSQVIVHYNPELPIYVSCDASSYGVGAVLSHKVKGVEKPILFASSTLSQAEQKYSKIEREALAIMFAVRIFHKYIFGRKFILVTDHKPLQFIFGDNKSISVTSAARVTRWALILASYEYRIEYRKGSLLANADALSRLVRLHK